jgi:hypothetical protein
MPTVKLNKKEDLGYIEKMIKRFRELLSSKDALGTNMHAKKMLKEVDK